MAAVPDLKITNLLLEEARELSVAVKLEIVFGSDAFYVEDMEFVKNWLREEF